MTDPWHSLRRYTQARIALGRIGCGLPTSAQLDFQLAHAQARDAVHTPWETDGFEHDLQALGLKPFRLESRTADRVQYLQRPELGRRLSEQSRQRLRENKSRELDTVLTVTNGLSSTAVNEHGLALTVSIARALGAAGLILGPICLVPNGRVALSDEIGELLEARLSVIIVGERPGLSAADSLGIYLTHAPRLGNTDAERNCISNIRPPAGLSYEIATAKLVHLAQQALRLGISGVALKDETPARGSCRLTD